jgi:hypothetical protein
MLISLTANFDRKTRRSAYLLWTRVTGTWQLEFGWGKANSRRPKYQRVVNRSVSERMTHDFVPGRTANCWLAPFDRQGQA